MELFEWNEKINKFYCILLVFLVWFAENLSWHSIVKSSSSFILYFASSRNFKADSMSFTMYQSQYQRKDDSYLTHQSNTQCSEHMCAIAIGSYLNKRFCSELKQSKRKKKNQKAKDCSWKFNKIQTNQKPTIISITPKTIRFFFK